MKVPAGLQPLIDDGVIDQVIRPLKSGKEAAVYCAGCVEKDLSVSRSLQK